MQLEYEESESLTKVFYCFTPTYSFYLWTVELDLSYLTAVFGMSSVFVIDMDYGL